MSKKKEVCLILDNIRSAHNVGAIFRTADAFGVEKIYLCGITPRPGGSVGDKITKTALGAENTIAWEYHVQSWRCAEKLKKEGIGIIALEQHKNSIDIKKFNPQFQCAIIVGNEVTGVGDGVINRADEIVEISMMGTKESLNVSVALGIVLYTIRSRL